MSNNRKKLAGLLTIGLLLLVGIAGTFAYLTDKTVTKRNTFTIGKVGITLTEPKWDAVSTHKIIPGVVFDKDPTITVTAGSEASYVFLEVTPSPQLAELKAFYTLNYDTTKWTPVPGITDKTVYYYTTIVPASGVEQKLAPLFTTVTFKNTLTSDQLKELTDATIDLKGYAIQSSGFDNDPAAAWGEVSK